MDGEEIDIREPGYVIVQFFRQKHLEIERLVSALKEQHDAAIAQARAEERERREKAEAERDALQRHFTEAAPEHNLPALLDVYYERQKAAEAERDALQKEINDAKHALVSYFETTHQEHARLLTSVTVLCERVDGLIYERDALRADLEKEQAAHRQTITTADAFRKAVARAEADVESLTIECERNAQHEGLLVMEREQLREDLRAVETAAELNHLCTKGKDYYSVTRTCRVCDALARPGVRAVVES